jgi:Uma2 family endonuclease
MQERHTVPLKIDEKMLADYPELAVLTLDLPESDGEPVETERERMQINLILDVLDQHWQDRQDFYAAGNMFLYYCAEQARQIIAEEADPVRPRRAFRGPDVFIVLNVDGNIRRQKWVVWEEGGRYPNVIFEFLSPSTRQIDRTTKKELYAQVFRTQEYYWYDPFAPRELQGWQWRAGDGYQAMVPDDRGWLWSPSLQLWIGRWEGTYKRAPATWLRLYDQEGRLALTSDEAAEQRAEAARVRAEAEQARAEAEQARAEAEQARAEAEQARAEMEQARAEAEQARAEMERTHAEAERTRADTAEAEVARLHAELARLRGENP